MGEELYVIYIVFFRAVSVIYLYQIYHNSRYNKITTKNIPHKDQWSYILNYFCQHWCKIIASIIFTSTYFFLRFSILFIKGAKNYHALLSQSSPDILWLPANLQWFPPTAKSLKKDRRDFVRNYFKPILMWEVKPWPGQNY